MLKSFRSIIQYPISKIPAKGEARHRRQYSAKGFTLIELLVVIAIISILAGLLMVNFIGVRQRGRDAQRKSDLRQIQSALELHRSDNGYYPSTLPSCGSAFTFGATTYMQKIPCDPLQATSYTYAATPAGCSTDCSAYTIYACLENINDSQKDAADGAAGDLCTTTGVVSHTLTNP